MPIELLAPAKDLNTGITAVNCGADAVYIGAVRFGAREDAGNPLAEIAKLVEYAHRYWARVYVTLNTLLHDAEIPAALTLIRQIHESGADALIIQDAGLLECDLPPIALFASTQMHNHTPERVRFLEGVGFKRVILARELSLEQIRSIRAQTSVELETFIHGALCVSYSGQCNLSYAIGGRSGNRGQCAQPCRNLYTLTDGSGRALEKPRHWLSIRDLNLSGCLTELMKAGVTSFKIEGRLKDEAYVRNVVSHYRRELDRLQVQKSSSGTSEHDFEPDLEKTFNRGYCDYFLHGRRAKIGSPATPKMIGEAVGKIGQVKSDAFLFTPKDDSIRLHNGDGLSFFNYKGELDGTLVNRVEGDWVYPARMEGICPSLELHRNLDKVFMDKLKASQIKRKIGVAMCLSEGPGGLNLDIRDEDGNQANVKSSAAFEKAEKPELALEMIQKQLARLGDSEFMLNEIHVDLQNVPFLPAAAWNELRRTALDALRHARIQNRPLLMGGVMVNDFPFPVQELDYRGNVLNQKAADFYRRHGVTKIEPAAESGLDLRGRRVMTSKYCLKYELDACPRHCGKVTVQEPLTLVDEDGHRLRLVFDCGNCEMGILFEGKGA